MDGQCKKKGVLSELLRYQLYQSDLEIVSRFQHSSVF